MANRRRYSMRVLEEAGVNSQFYHADDAQSLLVQGHALLTDPARKVVSLVIRDNERAMPQFGTPVFGRQGDA